MSGIGWTEIFLIALILLIFVGPRRLPELFGKIAWMISQLRAASRDLRNQLNDELVEIKQAKADFTAEMKAQTDRLYAEARSLDDEYKALQDDVNDEAAVAKNGLKKLRTELGDPESGDNEAKNGEEILGQKQLKG